jgi:hypothetical protein
LVSDGENDLPRIAKLPVQKTVQATLSYLEIIVCDWQITARSNSIAFRTAIKKVTVFMAGTVMAISGHMSSNCSW